MSSNHVIIQPEVTRLSRWYRYLVPTLTPRVRILVNTLPVIARVAGITLLSTDYTSVIVMPASSFRWSQSGESCRADIKRFVRQEFNLERFPNIRREAYAVWSCTEELLDGPNVDVIEAETVRRRVAITWDWICYIASLPGSAQRSGGYYPPGTRWIRKGHRVRGLPQPFYYSGMDLLYSVSAVDPSSPTHQS